MEYRNDSNSKRTPRVNISACFYLNSPACRFTEEGDELGNVVGTVTDENHFASATSRLSF